MSGDEPTRFCSRCQKHVHDLASLEAREIEALIEATQGRFCARITRDRFGRMVTREPEVLPFHVPITFPARRSSPAVAAVAAAAVGLTGAGWAQAPVATPIAVPVAALAGNLAAADPAHPVGPRGAELWGQVVDDRGSPLPGATVSLRHPEQGWRLIAITNEEGQFHFRDFPSGVYDVVAELEGFDFKTAVGLKIGPERPQIIFTGAMSETDTITVSGEVWMPADRPLEAVAKESHVMVAGTVGPSVTLRELPGSLREIRTELRITSILKGKPRGGTLQVDHYVIQGESEALLPGDVVLALLDPFGPGEGGPDSLVYISEDPLHALRPLPADPRLRPELGVDEAGWRAMSYIASATHNGVLQELVTQAIQQVEAAQRQSTAGRRDKAEEERLRARTAAIDEELRHRFVQVLRGRG
jgi:hypothetical protein